MSSSSISAAAAMISNVLLKNPIPLYSTTSLSLIQNKKNILFPTRSAICSYCMPQLPLPSHQHQRPCYSSARTTPPEFTPGPSHDPSFPTEVPGIDKPSFPSDMPGIESPPEFIPLPGIDQPPPTTPGPDFPSPPAPSPPRPDIPVPPPDVLPRTPPEVVPRKPPGFTPPPSTPYDIMPPPSTPPEIKPPTMFA